MRPDRGRITVGDVLFDPTLHSILFGGLFVWFALVPAIKLLQTLPAYVFGRIYGL